jgi:hypothetical protein
MKRGQSRDECPLGGSEDSRVKSEREGRREKGGDISREVIEGTVEMRTKERAAMRIENEHH